MKNVICIVARNNSMRLPHKVLREVHGKKMIEHIISSMKMVESADEIYVCTSVDENDKILLDIASENQVKSYAGSRDAVIERILTVAEREKADNVIRVTGDNIFTDASCLDYAIRMHVENDADYTRVENLPYGVTGEVMKVSSLIDCCNSIDPDESEYLTVFMYDPEKYKCVVVTPPSEVQVPYTTLTVDTPDDWARTEFIYDKLNKDDVSLQDIIELSKQCDIPHFKLDPNSQVKLPRGVVITQAKYKEMNRKKMEKSIVLQMH